MSPEAINGWFRCISYWKFVHFGGDEFVRFRKCIIQSSWWWRVHLGGYIQETTTKKMLLVVAPPNKKGWKKSEFWNLVLSSAWCGDFIKLAFKTRNMSFSIVFSHRSQPQNPLKTKKKHTPFAQKKKHDGKTIFTRWFKVTFWSPSWRSLNLWKGHLTIPKRSPRIARHFLFLRSFANFQLAKLLLDLWGVTKLTGEKPTWRKPQGDHIKEC